MSSEQHDVEKPRPKIDELIKQKSVTMEYFIESRNLDKETAELLRKYDRDENGSFSKDEVVSIILDLKEHKRAAQHLEISNNFFKKLLVVAVVLCMLLLGGMFGLSFAVTALTANMDVSTEGNLVPATSTTNSATTYIATDGVANIYEISKLDGIYCVTEQDAELINNQVFNGRNVLVELDEFDDDNHVFVEKLNASGADVDPMTGEVCFPAPELGEGKQLCLKYDDRCAAASRKLLRGTGRELELMLMSFQIP